MESSEMKNMLETIGLPVAYHSFGKGEEIKPPFIIYYIDEENPFNADDESYVEQQDYIVEVYTDKKDSDLERKVKDLFKINKIPWTKSEAYIESQNMFGNFFYLSTL